MKKLFLLVIAVFALNATVFAAPGCDNGDVELGAWTEPATGYNFNYGGVGAFTGNNSQTQAPDPVHGGFKSCKSIANKYALGYQIGGASCKVTGLNTAGDTISGFTVWVQKPSSYGNMAQIIYCVDGGNGTVPDGELVFDNSDNSGDQTMLFFYEQNSVRWIDMVNGANEDTWVQLELPSTTVGANDGTTVIGLIWWYAGGATPDAFYLDDFEPNSAPPPLLASASEWEHYE